MTGADPLAGRRFATLVLAAQVALSAPYVAWWLRTPPGFQSLGTNFINLGDLYAYLSWMKQGEQGHLLFLNLYDPAPQPRTLLLPFFLALGLGCRATGLSLLVVYHAARIATSVLLMLSARRLCRQVLGEGPAAARAFLMLTLATGLPNLVPASPVAAMFDSALHAFALALLMDAARCWLGSCATGRVATAAAAGGWGAALLLVHPFDAVGLAAMVAATAGAQILRGDGSSRGIVARVAAMAGVMAPAAAVVAWGMLSNPSLRGWSAQPRVTHLWHLLSFATLPLLAMAGLGRRDRRDADLLVAVWAGTLLGLSLLPFPSQQKLLLGLQPPLAILAARGFDALRASGRPRVAAVLLAGAFPVTGLMLLLDATGLAPTPSWRGASASGRHLDAALAADVASLAELPPGIILAPPTIGYFVPALAGRQVYLGHFDMTPDAIARREEYRRFVEGELQSEDLAARGIRWVVLYAGTGEPLARGLRRHASLARTVVYEVPPP